MRKKPGFKPKVTRIKLNPEQAVLACACYTLNNRSQTYKWTSDPGSGDWSATNKGGTSFQACNGRSLRTYYDHRAFTDDYDLSATVGIS